eukprot:m51a1_g12349 putative non-processive endoglucanase (705) ;mRNA; f:536099-540417
MRFLPTVALITVALAALADAGCSDVSPDSQYTCAQQVAWGKCSESYMKGFCDRSCGRCRAQCEDVVPDNMKSFCDVSCGSNVTCIGVPTALNGPVMAVGVNYAQHSWAQGWMTDFMDDNWDSKFEAMKRELSEIRSKGARVVRWWIFANSGILPESCWNGPLFAALPAHYADHVEAGINYAHSIGLMVYPALMSFDWGRGSEHRHLEIFTDSAARQSWISNALAPIVERLRNNAGVFAWDLMNEPEWIVDSADGGDRCDDCARFKLADLKAYLNGVMSMIRGMGAKQPISLGSASLKYLTQKRLWNDMDLDFWDFHWYSWATQYFNPLLQEASKVIEPSKPVIIGEVMPDPSQDSVLSSSSNLWCNGQTCTDHGRLVTKLAELGYSGYLPWAWTDPNFVLAPRWAAKFGAIKRELGEIRGRGARVVRWWLFANSDVLPASCWRGSAFVGLPVGYVDHVEEAVTYARSIGLLVYPSLMSFDWGKGSRHHQEIFTDPAARRSWIDNAVVPIVERLRNNAGVFGWDLMNEPEWVVDSADGGDPCTGCSRFRLADVKALLNGVLAMMRAKGARQPVSLGSASLKFLTQKRLWNDMALDFWDFHWYSWATSYFNPLLREASQVISPSKPVVIGEVMPNLAADPILSNGANRWCDGQTCTDHGRVLRQLAKLGYSGYMPWAWTDPNFVLAPHVGNHFVAFEAVCPAQRRH